MRVVVQFLNIGDYHAARLEAFAQRCREHEMELIAIQSVDLATQHPWGTVSGSFRLETLVAQTEVPGMDTIEGVPLAARRIPGVLDRLRPDYVAVAGWGHPEMRASLRWCHRNRVPVVTMSETKHDDTQRRWWRERLKYHRYIRQCGSALVGGTVHCDYLIELGFSPARIFLGYDAVDNAHFAFQAATARAAPDLARAGLPPLPRRPFFLASNRFVARKNLPTLLRAYACYRRDTDADEAWDLVLCGHGEQERLIHGVIAEEHLQPYVHLPGFLSYRRMGTIYGLAAAFMHAALTEPWGLVVNEACAAGLPILCSDTVGASHDLVRAGENGYLFDPRLITAMAATMTAVHRLSPGRRAAFGARSQELVAAFGTRQFADGLVAALEAASTR